MSRYSNSGTKENHAKLSFWSKQSIRQILLDQRMSFCLHRIDTPFCGDGIVQEGEVSSKAEAAIYRVFKYQVDFLKVVQLGAPWTNLCKLFFSGGNVAEC